MKLLTGLRQVCRPMATALANPAVPALGWLAVLLVTAAAPLLACYGPEYDGLHFNDARPDFFRMPQPAWGRVNDHRAWTTEPWRVHVGRENETLQAPDPPSFEKKAARLEQEGRFREAATAWEQFRHACNTAVDEDSWAPSAPPELVGLDDRLAALRAWRGPADTPALRRYLEARTLVSHADYKRPRALLRTLKSGPLRQRAAYLRATIRFYTGSDAESIAAFRKLVTLYPADPLPRYMLGRSYFAPVLSADAEAEGDAADSRQGGGRPLVGPSRPHLAPLRRAEYLRKALEAYSNCAALASATPLGEDAAGMAAGCAYRLGDLPEALLRYCRILQTPRSAERNKPAWISARKCLHRMNLAEHHRFQQQAMDQPRVAAIYLDLLLHWERLGARSNAQLGQFAATVLRRHPEAPLASLLLTRLALVEDRAGRADRAVQLAVAAVRRAAPGPEQDQARWQHAEALVHLRREAEALAEYERLARESRIPRLRSGAHEAAAVLDERRRDYAEALRHYFALEYQLDYAYVIDCLATPNDLRAFLRRYPRHPRANLVRYSLGFRQLRAGEYTAAARTFASLGPWLEVAERKYPCTLHGDRGSRMPPLAAARFLVDAQSRERQAGTTTAKAVIAYRTGQLLFHQRHLLFYNGALWTGRRTAAMELDLPYNVPEGTEQLSREEQAARTRYQEEHAALHQALRVFERIAREYPHTPEAPKALYSAAVCCTLLPSLERYWSEERAPELQSRAIRYYHQLQREYPQDPLAKAAAQYGGEVRR